MAANNLPLYPVTPIVTFGLLTTANTALDGTGTVVTVLTAGSNGHKPAGITFRATGTNVATVARIFINNGAGSSVNTNNGLFSEITLPATTASSNSALADMRYIFPEDFRLPSGYKVNLTVGTTVASSISAVGFGGDY